MKVPSRIELSIPFSVGKLKMATLDIFFTHPWKQSRRYSAKGNIMSVCLSDFH
jgi:hypothetical protein